MNKLSALLRIHFLGYFGLNKAIHTKVPGQKRKAMAMAIGALILTVYFAGISYFYSDQLGKAFQMVDAMELLPGLMMASASLVTLVTTIYKVNGTLFNFRDYDMIMALPVKTGVIVASRMLMLYVLNFGFVLLVMVPAGVVYGLRAGPDKLFYGLFAFSLLLLPLVPIVVATAVGVAIHLVSARFRYKNLINILLSVAALVAFMAGSGSINTSGVDLADVGGSMLTLIQRMYPLTRLYVEGVCNFKMSSFLTFAGISLLTFGVFAGIVGLRFKRFQTAMTTISTRRNYVMRSQAQDSPLMALYKKELRRYFASPIYVLNTGFGVVMYTVMAVALMFFRPESIGQLLEMPMFSDYVQRMAPLVAAVFMALSSTTTCSISLEGKGLWIAKSLPVGTMTVFLSKILVNLSITLPAVFVNGLLLMMALKTGFVDSILLLLVPAVYAVFVSLMGLVVNLHFPYLDWVSETQAVKQSAATLISMLLGIASIAAPLTLLIKFSALNAQLAAAGTVVILALVSAGLYSYLASKGASLLQRL